MSKLVNRFLPTFPRFASCLCDQSHVDTRIWRVFAVFLCKDSSDSDPNEDSCEGFLAILILFCFLDILLTA